MAKARQASDHSPTGALNAHLQYASMIVLSTVCCLVIMMYAPASWGPHVVWAMAAPGAGLLFGAIPSFLIGRRAAAIAKQAAERDDLIGLLLKDYAADRGDWVWTSNVEGDLVGVSEKFATHAGQPAAALERLRFGDFIKQILPEGGPAYDEMVMAMRQRQPFFDLESRVHVRGEVRSWRLAAKPIYRDGRFAGYVGTASDITTETQARETMRLLAYRDGLTGLSNRSHFSEKLTECVARLERYGTAFSVLYLDLDKFKAVNDSRGHQVGDQLLVEVGKRLSGLVGENDLVARLGGDEFSMILTGDVDGASISALAVRLIEEIRRPYQIDGAELVVGLSLGIAIAPINGTRPDQILRNADLALYRAKAEGGNRHCFFENRMDSELREKRMLELEITEALERDEFQLYYQPVIAAADGSVSGFEALIRWNHPIRGVVSPAEFIPIAEQSSLIGKMGEWTLNEACRMLSRLPEHYTMAINLSTKHFRSADIASLVEAAVASAGIAPHRLELEITESLLIEDPEDMADKLRALKRAGAMIAMDDFGTGYSSLSYLLKFPFDKIKIDRSFVSASSEGAAAREILRSIVSLAGKLSIKVTSEGVETREQAILLKEIGSNLMQGYYFAKPMPEDRLAAWLAGRIIEPVEPEGRLVTAA